MANFGQLVLTNLGLQAQYNAQSGEPLKFKRIAMGSGDYSGNIAVLTDLVTENVSVDISKGYIQNNAFVVEGFFSNEGLQTGFAWREIGLYVEDENGGEILYCYANAGDTYDYIPATSDERYSKYIRIATTIGNATNVSFENSEGFIYVDSRTFNEAIDILNANDQEIYEEVVLHKFDSDNPHGVTAEQVGAAKDDLSNVKVLGNSGLVPIVNATSSDGVTYTATIEGLTTIPNGFTIVFVSNKANTGNTPKLNINGLGEKVIICRYSDGTNRTTILGANYITSNFPLVMTYNKNYNYWFLQSTKPSVKDLDNAVPISKGGTGATKATNALINLGATPQKDFDTHKDDTDNPHGVTAEQTGALPTSGGTVTGTIKPETPVTTNIGEEAVPFGTMHSKHFKLFSHADKKVGEMSVHITGTTERRGETVIGAGNDLPEGVEGNARGRVRLYGTDSGYIDVISSNESATNYEILLPNGNGTLALNGEVLKIEQQTYKGTHKYGSDYKNILTFKGEPQILIVRDVDDNVGPMFAFRGCRLSYVVGESPDHCVTEWDGNTVSWYSSENRGSQMNNSATNYLAIAIYL